MLTESMDTTECINEEKGPNDILHRSWIILIYTFCTRSNALFLLIWPIFVTNGNSRKQDRLCRLAKIFPVLF